MKSDEQYRKNVAMENEGRVRDVNHHKIQMDESAVMRAMNETIERTKMARHKTGAIRSTDADTVRFDLISHIGLRRIAETYHEGSVKYGDNNWRKGFTHSCLLNHAMRHLNLYNSGDRSEDHLAHATWNLLTMMEMEETRPELCDLWDSPESIAQMASEANAFAFKQDGPTGPVGNENQGERLGPTYEERLMNQIRALIREEIVIAFSRTGAHGPTA